MNVMKSSVLALIVASSTFALPAAFAAVKTSAFGATYQPVQNVGNSQSQVVFYRDTADKSTGSANVYVDGEFQAALLPGGFNVFCVAAGSHSLGAFKNDAPLYIAKSSQPFRATMQGGETYFLKVSADNSGMPLAEQRRSAEQQLSNYRQQMHALSRASAVQACNYTGPAAKAMKKYNLSSDVLFAFGKSSRADLTQKGRRAVQEMVSQIRRENSELGSVQVIGHSDPIGKASANDALGQRRAATVRQLMIEAGIPARDITASSAGSSELEVQDCYGSRAEQIQCNAPNRRVEIRVDGSQAE